MRTAITIIELARAPGTFQARVSGLKGTHNAGRDPAAAAATAVDLAIRFGGIGYVIFAPAKVLTLIPADMRHAGQIKLP